MKICILLTGLQRNFEPFIENQLNLVISRYELDTFVFTSNQNVLRVNQQGIMNYVKKTNYENDEEFFRSKYKTLKGICIDHDDLKFNKFVRENKIKKHKNHTLNMVSSYFKVNECIKLMEEYELQNNFKYDLVIRCRLDFFAYEDFLNPFEIDPSMIYLPQSKYNEHIDDSGFIMKRDRIEYFKQFINIIIGFDDKNDYIYIENELIEYLKKKYKLNYVANFSYRIGTNNNLSEIPFVNQSCINKLDSIEYKDCLKSTNDIISVQKIVPTVMQIAPLTPRVNKKMTMRFK
jgi:hypothetical protein